MSGVVVYLVGAGPGDDGLITVRGAELLASADVVVYDYLSNPLLLNSARPDARTLYVGKKGFKEHVTQGEINELLVEEARRLQDRGGGSIVRLKGGDPFVFGRGGEEALALKAAGIAFEVVPGVTSGVAAATYAGIPVTHRGLSSTVTFVTGNEDPAKRNSAIDWQGLASLAQAGGTICFYMGMRNLPALVESLVAHGMSPTTPAAVIQWGTLPRQRSLKSNLETIVADVERIGLGAPAIVVVGAVVALRDDVSWFERRPLFGRRIVVTRARAQASGLVSRLAELGANVVEFPTIAIEPPSDPAPLEAAMKDLPAYDWLVFTSVNGVEAFFSRLAGDARQLAGLRVAAIGPATAKCLLDHGIRADAVPTEYRGEAVLPAMKCASSGETLEGERVLIVRAEQARQALPDLLDQAGALVRVVAAYRTVVPDAPLAHELADDLAAGRIDAIAFSSSSTVRNLMTILGNDAAAALGDVDLFSIGPITSETLRRFGFSKIHEAAVYTTEGLVGALLARYAQEGKCS